MRMLHRHGSVVMFYETLFKLPELRGPLLPMLGVVL
jgi:hypothetical protein